MPTYSVEFVVRARSRFSAFPIDMLRYDGCYPATENDSGEIVETMARRREEPKVMAPIKVKKITTNARWYPQTGRWESFGWRVDDESVEKRKL